MDALEQAALSGALTSPPVNEADPDGREPPRWEDLSDRSGADEDDGEGPRLASQGNAPNGLGMTRGWSGNTGPKGVLQDFKASHGKSGAILGGAVEGTMERMNLGKNGHVSKPSQGGKSGSRSGSESEGEREVKEARRRERIAEMQRAQGGRGSPGGGGARLDENGKRFHGHLKEIGVANFVSMIDAEKDHPETAVIIHLFDPALESCNILNTHLATLARRFPYTKFMKGLAAELDFFTSPPNAVSAVASVHTIPALTPSPSRTSFSTVSTGGDPFRDRNGSIASLDPFADGLAKQRRRATDSDVLPTIVYYRGGEVRGSIIAVERELADGELKRGDEGCKEVQNLLVSHGLIGASDSITDQRGRLLNGGHNRVASPDI